MATAAVSAIAKAWLTVWASLTAGLALVCLLVLTVIDPYGTGRFTPFTRPVIYDTGPRIAHLTRMRDPNLNAVIIGNSTIQILNPERLNALTGFRFANLSVPGTGPHEQIVMIDHLLRTHPGPLNALVIGLDSASWCDPTRLTRAVNPFPFWLYTDTAATYLSGLFRMDAMEAAPRRIGMLLGRERQARPDGFWDYELIRKGAGPKQATHRVPPLPPPTASAASAAEGLNQLLRRLPDGLRVVLVHPPLFAPEGWPDPAYQARMDTCKAEFGALPERYRSVKRVDLWTVSPVTRNPEGFLDYNHYKRPVAEWIEQELARALLQ